MQSKYFIPWAIVVLDSYTLIYLLGKALYNRDKTWNNRRARYSDHRKDQSRPR